jgi:O-antigen/teichoic acid export membrane protein
MKKIKDFIGRFHLKGSFAGHVITLMTGTALAQGITSAAIPILTRFYNPENFGILSIFMGIASIITVWSALRYELAIVIPERQEDATALVKLSFSIAIIISFLSFIVIIALGRRIVTLFDLPYMDPWLKYLPLSIFSAGFYNILYYWCTRNKWFNKISISRVFQSIATVFSQLVAFPLFKAGVGGLIGGYIIGQMSGVGILLAQLKGVRFWNPMFSFLRTKVATTYSDFPKYSGSGAFFDTAAAQIPLIAIPIFFSLHIGGLYAFADRLLRVPAGLVGASVSQVFYQRLAQSKRDRNERKRIILSAWKYLFLVGLGPMAVAFLFGPSIFAFFLGAHWREAGQYAQILSIGFMAHFVAYPTSLGIVALERLDILLGWQVLNFLSMITVFSLGYLFFRNNIFSFLWMWSCKELIMYILYMIALWKAHSHGKIKTH